MELTKNHRASLLNSLTQVTFELENDKLAMDKQINPDDHQWFEIKHFLSQQLIKTITDALVANDIDY